MDTTNLIQKLKSIQDSHVKVYVPSVNKELEFKPLNIKQQKDIIKSTFDKNIPGLSFYNILNGIIKDNCVDKTATFLVLDRNTIAIALRNNIFGNEYTVDETNNSSFKVNLNEVLNIINEPVSNEVLEHKIKQDSLEVTLKAPSLETDNKVNKESQKLLSHFLDDSNGAKDLISELFIYEIVKFVHEVKFGENVVSFKDITVSQQIEILESLTANINKQILEYIEVVRNFESKYITFNKSNKEYRVTIDPAFFNRE